ncbi:hypothetical protein EVAR_62301_1 [Eumeta japonica]|uniref:Uncharacterized protein n=1 Tax=Eumeta variegata TaxID=151549 RepID=A0A4C1ZGT9_EUMVA|nr:hypothetical protein EVAR_62301_1 [Eumeta japonica]
MWRGASGKGGANGAGLSPPPTPPRKAQVSLRPVTYTILRTMYKRSQRRYRAPTISLWTGHTSVQDSMTHCYVHEAARLLHACASRLRRVDMCLDMKICLQ